MMKFLKKLGFTEHQQHLSYNTRSLNRKLCTGFLGASLVILTVIFINYPLKSSSLFYPMFNGITTSKSPIVSWPFTFSTTTSSNLEERGLEKPRFQQPLLGNFSLEGSGNGGGGVLEEPHQGGLLEKGVNGSFLGSNGGDLGIEKSLVVNFTVSDKNGSFFGGEVKGGNFSKKGDLPVDYNCSVDFVSAPFLVRESSFSGRNGSVDTLRLDLMDRTTSMYHDADVIVFNTGHWWTHEKTSKGENYYQEGNHVYPRLKVMEAFQKALNTWVRWVDNNVDRNRTQVFFRGYSVTHFRGGQWNSGGQCHKETEPIFNDTFLAKYPSKMRALEQVLPRMKTPVMYMNISKLTDYRKDAHPSIYRKVYTTVEEHIAAEASQDCSHWCLPGVPDTWNELLYASLLRVGRGSWRP
ncbi:hypothetical protein GIB67_014051 [Kingdonia uniflora]|uniref:Trichome birefringence-like C-terminal domain-containing protein n=1 Tax=Kingdonia uniflora TaxID=39325 RepID=A0A7J7KXH5_9MAGN|nr:hypothetical protein GIB67_014051 [Kingdonia uniflora]